MNTKDSRPLFVTHLDSLHHFLDGASRNEVKAKPAKSGGLRPLYGVKTVEQLTEAVYDDRQARLLAEASQLFEGCDEATLANITAFAECYGFYGENNSAAVAELQLASAAHAMRDALVDLLATGITGPAAEKARAALTLATKAAK